MVRKEIDAENELFGENLCKREREISDGRYAPMNVKTIVYGAMGMIAAGFLGYLFIKVGWK